MNRCLAAFLALLFASLTVSSACLAEPNGQATQLVRYDGRDLATPEGLKALNRRIELAANRVCPDAYGPSPGVEVDLACKAEALASGRSQIETAVAQYRLRTAQALAAIEPDAAPTIPEVRR